MAKIGDTVTIEIKGLERFEAAVDRFARSVEEFGRMAATTTQAAEGFNLVIQAAEVLTVEEAASPMRFPVDPFGPRTFLASGSGHDWDSAPDGSTVHLPARPSKPISDDEPLTPNPLDRYTNR